MRSHLLIITIVAACGGGSGGHLVHGFVMMVSFFYQSMKEGSSMVSGRRVYNSLTVFFYFFLPRVKKLLRLGSSLRPSALPAGSVMALVGDAASAPEAELNLLIQLFISPCNKKTMNMRNIIFHNYLCNDSINNQMQ